MDKEAATILAESIKGLQSAIMYWAIAYKEHTAFQDEQVTAELKRMEGLIIDKAETAKNNDSDNDGN